MPRETPILERRHGKSILDMKANLARSRTRILRTGIFFGTLSISGVHSVARLTLKEVRIDWMSLLPLPMLWFYEELQEEDTNPCPSSVTENIP